MHHKYRNALVSASRAHLIDRPIKIFFFLTISSGISLNPIMRLPSFGQMISQQFPVGVEDYAVMSFRTRDPDRVRGSLQPRTRYLSDRYRRGCFFVVNEQAHLAASQYSVVRYGLEINAVKV